MKKMPLALMLALGVVATGASAGEREDMEILRQTTINLIQALVEKGVLAQDAAQALIKKAEDDARRKVAQAPAKDPGTVRVQYVPESVKQEIREQVKQEVISQAKAERWADTNAIPEWVRGMKWEGDLRLRYQSDQFDKDNAASTTFSSHGETNVTNTLEDQTRARLRARLGLLASVNPWVSAGFRLTTGTTSDPVSTNQSLGNYENKYSFVLDRAYLKLTPIPALNISGGRIPNPYFSTDLVWDDDLNFEGAAATLRTPDANDSAFRPFVTAGAYMVQSIEQNAGTKAKDKWFWGVQGGFDWRLGYDTRLKLGVAQYDFKNVEGIPNTPAEPNAYDKTVPLYRQKGNSVFDISTGGSSVWALASKFRLVNYTGSLDLAQFDPMHIILTGDYVKNIGFDRSEILNRTTYDIEPRTKGWQGKLAFGMPSIREEEDWQFFVGYRYLERDAVIDAFTDSDFRLGGTDAKGYFFGGHYGLYKNTWLSMRWMSGREIDGQQLATSSTKMPLAVDVFQVDLNAKF